MTPEYFLTLTKRDFDNGAIMDDIRKTIRQAHMLSYQVQHCRDSCGTVLATQFEKAEEIAKAIHDYVDHKPAQLACPPHAHDWLRNGETDRGHCLKCGIKWEDRPVRYCGPPDNWTREP